MRLGLSGDAGNAGAAGEAGPESDPYPAIDLPLSELIGERLRPVKFRQDPRLLNALASRHHYLDWSKPFGIHIRYFIFAGFGRLAQMHVARGLLGRPSVQDLADRLV